MPNKTIATFATAIAFGTLAGAAIAAPEQQQQQQQAETSARECHAAPKGVAPEGAHWYYKTNRATNKKCWYLADKVARTHKAAAAAPARATDSDDAAPKPEKPEARKSVENSVADARAEIPDDTTAAETQPNETASDSAPAEPATGNQDPNLADSVWPALPDGAQTGTAAAPQPATDDAGAFAQRWPDQVSTTAPTDAQAMLARKKADQRLAAAAQTKPAAATTVGSAGAAIADEPAESSVGTIGLVLSVLAGLLALAAIMGPSLFRRLRPQRPAAPRRGIWDDVDTDNPPMPWDAEQAVQNDNQPRDLRDLDAPDSDPHPADRNRSGRSAA